jgi:hypothetical protein
MNISKKIIAGTAGSVLALTMASCGGGGGAGSATGDTLTIGIKYDQPGLGQKSERTSRAWMSTWRDTSPRNSASRATK